MFSASARSPRSFAPLLFHIVASLDPHSTSFTSLPHSIFFTVIPAIDMIGSGKSTMHLRKQVRLPSDPFLALPQAFKPESATSSPAGRSPSRPHRVIAAKPPPLFNAFAMTAFHSICYAEGPSTRTRLRD